MILYLCNKTIKAGGNWVNTAKRKMTTTTYTMTLQKFVENFKCQTSEDFYTGYETREEEANDLLIEQKQEMVNEFKKWATKFIEIKNYMNTGTYEFVSCDGETFLYTVTK